MTPPRNIPSAGVSGAALNPVTARMKILAPEIIIHRIAPKTTRSSKIQHRRRGTASPHERAAEEEVEDYMPPSGDEASLDDDEFVVPKDPVEQERFKRRLIQEKTATT